MWFSYFNLFSNLHLSRPLAQPQGLVGDGVGDKPPRYVSLLREDHRGGGLEGQILPEGLFHQGPVVAQNDGISLGDHDGRRLGKVAFEYGRATVDKLIILRGKG